MPVTRSFLLRLGLLGILLSFGWPASAFAFHGVSDREVVPGDILPKISRQTVMDVPMAIPAEEGITVLLFWATWSPRSSEALELWERFSNDYKGQLLTIITINAERDELSSQEMQMIDQYIVETIPNLPVIQDEGLRLFNAYAVSALPTAFFLENTGKVLYRYPSFPTSAPLDLKEELDITLGLKVRQTSEEKASRGRLDYQPKNNALLHYNMAVQLYKKGFMDKALERMVIALEKDPQYQDPLRTLEGVFFPNGRTPEAETRLRIFLLENGLNEQVDRIGGGEPIMLEAPRKIDAMERMRLLMEKNKPSIETSQ